MPYQLTDEQQLVRSSVREFAEAEIKPLAAGLDRDHKPPTEIIPRLAEMGILGMTIPQEYGGSWSGHLSLALTLEEIARCCATTAVMVEVHGSLCSEIISHWGNEEQKQHYLPKLASGEIIGAFCLTEPQAGSDAGTLATSAKQDGDSWVINGQKIFITNADFAGVFLLFVRTSDKPGTKGISAFLVDKDTPGLEIGAPERKMGLRGSSTCPLRFVDMRVPASAMLGEEGQGFKVAMSGLDSGRVGIAAQALGIAQAAYEEAVAYAKQRVQFGAPLASLQGIQWMIADMRTDLEAGRLLVYQAADLADRGLPYSQEASIAKLYCAQLANRTTDTAVQIHGGLGFIEGITVERLYRDCRITRIYEGTDEVQRLVIARNELR